MFGILAERNNFREMGVVASVTELAVRRAAFSVRKKQSIK